MKRIHDRLSKPSIVSLLSLSLIATLLVCLALAIAAASPPHIRTESAEAGIDISADSAWVLLPGQCVTITWEIAETLRVAVNDQDRANLDEMGYCPSLRSASPNFDIIRANGGHETFVLDIRYLPSQLVDCLYLATILSLIILAFYFLATERICAPIPFGKVQIFSLIALLILCLLCQTSETFSIDSLLNALKRLFTSPAWQGFGLLLAGLVFTPLIVQSLRDGLKKRSWEDFAAIGAFFVFVLVLYLPFGFDSIGHWEEWVFRHYLEDSQRPASSELVSRFWILVPNVLANVLSPGSFSGYHFVNLFMFWSKLALFYGILRRLRVKSIFAFLCTMVFMAYPVTSGLMSLRFFLMHFRIVSLLTAVYFALAYFRDPSRVRLAGIWLAILLNVGSYESAYAIIAIIPLLWWLRGSRRNWRKINMTVIWYLAPAAKLAYLLLLTSSNREFYGSGLVQNTLNNEGFGLQSLSYYAEVLERVYRQTLWYGWREAVTVTIESTWIVPTIGVLALAGVTAVYLARNGSESAFPSWRKIGISILSGLLFILPSVGVLMWIPKYSQDLRRLYIYVPIGAAIAVFSLALLVASLVNSTRLRKIVLVSSCLLAMLPGLSRLFAQHAFYVSSANNKAWILLQAVEQAPSIDSRATLVLVTEMNGVELRAKKVSELRTGMLNSAIAVLYENKGPNLAFICIIDKRCFKDELGLPAFHLHDGTDFGNLIIFYLHDDLSVELLRELPPELGGSNNDTYDPERLIDTSAPIPPRALTMLASARRD